ncbi:MAG: agmatinase [Rubrobacteraceae bacterium]|nr:agmatinase [Rubrobacteraceae bacterium]
MIDPLQRWASVGEKPDYAGLLTFAGAHYTQDPFHLEGVDVAIVGAPMDDLVSDRPGARFGPRAIRAASSPSGPELETSVDAIGELRVVDFGDAPVLPADPTRRPQSTLSASCGSWTLVMRRSYLRIPPAPTPR